MKREKNRAPKGTLHRVLGYMAGRKILLLLSVVCAAVSSVLMLYNPILIGQAVDCVTGTGSVRFDALTAILIRMAVIALAAAAAQLVMNLINNRITYGVVRDLRREAFLKLQTLPLSYLDRTPHGETISRLIADVDLVSDGLLLGFSQLFTGVVTIAGTLVFMFRIHALTAAVVVVLTPLSMVAAAFIAKRTYNLFAAQNKARGEQTGYIEEMTGGLKIISAFSHEKEAQEKFDSINETLRKSSLMAVFYSSLTNPVTRFVNAVVYAAVGILGSLLALRGSISVGALVSFLSYANQYTKPFNEISGVVTEFQNALSGAARIFELLDEPPEIPEDPDAEVIDEPQGSVRLSHVDFSYVPERELIRDLNLDVRQGQRIAIVGPTGSGKSTLINLLMRFYDVNGGSISLDGTDIRHLTRQSLRASYGMVLQETWLRRGTIRENLKMADPSASDEEMMAAARATKAHGFIRRLPEGYDTVLGEDGSPLSQGQKQLLCITRVMLHLPPMLILDEATSSIDLRTEQQVQKAFNMMMEGRTSFVVAHRLSTIREADCILVMEDGHIAEMGNHEQLMRKGGAYAKLYNSQFVAV